MVTGIKKKRFEHLNLYALINMKFIIIIVKSQETDKKNTHIAINV